MSAAGAGTISQGAKAGNPRYGKARLVVFGADPAALEPAVTQLEAQGARPAVFFQVPMAVLALDTHRPHVVLADVGTGAEPRPEAAAFLEHVRARAHAGGRQPALVLLGAPAAVGAAANGLPARAAAGDDPAALAAAVSGALDDAAFRPTGWTSPLGAGIGRVELVTALLVTLLLAFLWLRGRRVAAPERVLPQQTAVATAAPSATVATVPTAVPAATSPQAAAAQASAAVGSPATSAPATSAATTGEPTNAPPTSAPAATTAPTETAAAQRATTAAAASATPGQTSPTGWAGPIPTSTARVNVLPSTGSR